MDKSRSIDVRRADSAPARDRVAVEEPLEIRVGGRRLTVTMRTPGHDAELAAGFLVTEGLVTPAELGVIRACPDADENVVDVGLVDGARLDVEAVRRAFAATSACGLCGTTSIEQVKRRVAPLNGSMKVGRDLLTALPDRLRCSQEVFEATGGLHAAGLFAPDGTLELAREDIGRHNAVDKVIGAAALRGRLPLADRILVVSGRAGFEIVQKAAAAGIPILCSVSAPSSLAVELARETGMTLVGFLRGASFNVYAGEDKLTK